MIRAGFQIAIACLAETVSGQSGHSPGSVGSELAYSVSAGYTPPTMSVTGTANTTRTLPSF